MNNEIRKAINTEIAEMRETFLVFCEINGDRNQVEMIEELFDNWEAKIEVAAEGSKFINPRIDIIDEENCSKEKILDITEHIEEDIGMPIFAKKSLNITYDELLTHAAEIDAENARLWAAINDDGKILIEENKELHELLNKVPKTEDDAFAFDGVEVFNSKNCPDPKSCIYSPHIESKVYWVISEGQHLTDSIKGWYSTQELEKEMRDEEKLR